MDKVVVIDSCTIIHFMYAECWNLLKDLKYSVITTDSIQEEFESALKKKYMNSYIFFISLMESEDIIIYPLGIHDVMTMAKIPKSKNADKGELSCFALADRLGCKVMTDDEKAVQYIKKHLIMEPNRIISIIDIVLEAYIKNLIGDHDLKDIQKKLERNHYQLKIDLYYEGAKRKLFNGNFNT